MKLMQSIAGGALGALGGLLVVFMVMADDGVADSAAEIIQPNVGNPTVRVSLSE